MKDFRKDPAARLDYLFDWQDWLAEGETIDPDLSTVVVAPIGLTVTQDVADESVRVWASGGTVNAGYVVVCHIETSQGRKDERSIRIYVMDR